MIIKDYDQCQLSCDECGTETPVYDESEFERMLAESKSDGWKITRPEGRWRHTCEACSSDVSALAAAKRKFGLA